MKKLAKVLLIFLSILLFKENAFANSFRKTSFEERQNCEVKNNGIWREFGNSCGDSCGAKFDEFKICDNSLYNGCDCGINRCWDGFSCISLEKYKKQFHEENQKKLEEISKAKEERKLQAAQQRQERLKELIKNSEGKAMSIDIEGAANNYADAYKDALNAIKQSQIVQSANNNIANANNLKNGQNVKQDSFPVAPPIIIDSTSAKVPPAYLKKYEEQKKNQDSQEPALPVIPLPE